MKLRIALLIILLISLFGMNAFALPTDSRMPLGAPQKQQLPRVYQSNTQGKLIESTTSANWSQWAAGAKKAIRTVLPQWVQMASLTGGVVNGSRVTGGALTAPNILPLLYMDMKTAGVPDRIASGFMVPFTDAWTSWAASIRVPGLSWYPSFEMYPGPVAPPTPSPATPLRVLTQVTAPLTPSMLAQNIRIRLGNEASSKEAVTAINDFCNWFYSGFDLWLTSATIREVSGTGNVPHFAPPVVNSGPVVGGTANGGKISPLPVWP
jgi:hypothetical protein